MTTFFWFRYLAGRFASILILWLCTLATNALAQLPASFSNNLVQNGYTQPMGTVFSADAKQMFVWDKAGRVWVSNWNGTQYIKQPSAV